MFGQVNLIDTKMFHNETGYILIKRKIASEVTV